MDQAIEQIELERQHQELKGEISRLREVVESKPQGLSDALFRSMVRGEAAQLRERLLAHFEFEETGGYLDPVRVVRPTLVPRVTRLLDQHRKILGDFDQIEEACRGATSLDAVVVMVKCVLDRIGEHEEQEMDLLHDAIMNDLGTGD